MGNDADVASPLKPGRVSPGNSLAEAVHGAGAVVAVDVFDTLVERSIRPEHVKILACDRLVQMLGLEGVCGLDLYARRKRIERDIGRRTLAEAGEAEFRHAEMAAQLHSELRNRGILAGEPDAAGFADAALRAELAVEQQVLRLKPGALQALLAARSAGKTIWLISDFYLPATALSGLLAAIGLLPSLYDVLWVSSDHMASKRSGRLFDLVLSETGVAAADVTMIGDNPFSDVEMATRRGLRSVLVQDAARIDFYASEAAEVTPPRRLQKCMRELVETRGAPARHIRQAVPALLLFTERLHRAARRLGMRHLFFLSREGQVLERLFNAYQDALGNGAADRITTHYVLVSRRACFAASLAPLGVERFEGLFSWYPRISLRDFCGSLGFPTAMTEQIAARLARDPDAPEPDFPTSDTFRALLEDREFGAFYEAHRTGQRDNLRSYLAGFGVDLQRHPLAVVDCGWKGSIQDFIRGALPPEIAVQGFYIGLIGVGQDVSTKSGLLFSNIGGFSPDYFVFAENRSLFEMLLCADHGSALRYEPDADGRIRVVLDSDPVERDYIRETTLPIAADAEQVFRDLAAARAMTAIRPAEWERMVTATHASLVFRPWLPQARWLVEGQHRESFGVFHLSRLAGGGGISFGAKLRFFRQLLRRPRQVIAGSFWPALMLHAHGGRPLVRCYALFRQLRGRAS